MEAPARIAPVERTVDRAARENALRFGKLIRERREALGMRQDDLALATGVGRRPSAGLRGSATEYHVGDADRPKVEPSSTNTSVTP
jgi:hypothetical protein